MSLFAQADRGTITGTIVDTSGAVVPEAKVTVINSETQLRVETVSTSTGNYTIAALPSGNYSLTVEKAGFTKVERGGINIQVAVTTRLDVTLTIGAAMQSVDVSADATMLKTETAEQSSTISGKTVNDLPINFAIGAGAIRNPLSFVQLTPGATMTGWNTIQVNGQPAGSYRILLEGQESTNGLDARASDETQPSVEAIQEFTVQTSNFAAEYGQVGGGLFNFTSKSGTNRVHGSAYAYVANEAFDAGMPLTDDGLGHHVRPAVRRVDAGVSFGGPVYIPKIYNGKNKTFFFFNYEKYHDRENSYLGLGTVPTAKMRNGDFSELLTNRNLGTDFTGRPILENTIYDPTSRTTDSSGRFILQPFPNNVISKNLLDPVALKMMSYFPLPTNPNSIVNNYTLQTPFHKIQDLPSVKIDHNITSTSRISGYFADEITDKDVGQDGFPDPISIRRALHIEGINARINYDQSITPTLLVHLGAGVQRYVNPDTAPPNNTSFDSAGLLGLNGAPGTGFPRLGGVGTNTYGGLAQSPLAVFATFGTVSRGKFIGLKPTAVYQTTWVHNNHTYKVGGEWKIDTFTNISAQGLAPLFNFSSAQTAQPLYGQALPGGTTIGQPFASFLLGDYNSAAIANVQAPQYRKSSWALYIQDTWKITRKLSLDYGLRWDLQKPQRELNGRSSGFSASVINPNANGLGGAA